MSKEAKAFKQRSVTATVAIIFVAVVLVLVLAGVGLRFGAPSAWASGVDGVQSALDGPLLGLFKKLSVRYVDESPDLDADEKKAWRERMDKLSTALIEERGMASTRAELRVEYEGVVEKMKDGDLTKGELAPFEKKLDTLLQQVETEEVQKRE